MKKVFLVLILGISTLVPVSPIANAAGCPTGIWSGLYPGDCLLEYSEEATTVLPGSDFKLQPDLDSCGDYFAGIKINTGYDRVSYVRFQNIGTSGSLNTGKNLQVVVNISANCRLWKKSYLTSGEIKFGNGISVSVPLSEVTLNYRSKYSGSFDSYCFVNTCGDITYAGSFVIPPSASGSANFVLGISYNQDSATLIKLSPIEAKYNYSGYLFVGSTPTPTPTPTSTSDPNTINPSIPFTKVTLIADSSGLLACNSPDFTPSAVSTFGIIGTHWRFSTNNTAGEDVVLDEFDMGLGVQPNGDSIRKTLTNGESIALLINGDVYYGYALRNQIKGAGYKCSVAVRTSNGIGRYSTQIVFSSINSKDFTAVKKSSLKKSITCTKGKLSKKVKGTKPKCPTGYKKA